MDKATARNLIDAATNLEDLLDALQTIEAETDDVEALIDITSLPTYGGECPDNGIGVWSHDEDRLLVGEGSWAECEIIDRAEWT